MCNIFDSKLCMKLRFINLIGFTRRPLCVMDSYRAHALRRRHFSLPLSRSCITLRHCSQNLTVRYKCMRQSGSPAGAISHVAAQLDMVQFKYDTLYRVKGDDDVENSKGSNALNRIIFGSDGTNPGTAQQLST